MNETKDVELLAELYGEPKRDDMSRHREWLEAYDRELARLAEQRGERSE